MHRRDAQAGERSTAFALVTSLAAFVVAATGVADLLAHSVNLSTLWTCLVIAATLGLAAAPLLLSERFPPVVALLACWVFAAITALQVASSDGDVIMAVNNLVLYPMIACYLGWFFDRRIARFTVLSLFALSAAALLRTDHLTVFTSWANLALASFFCLEAALYLRTRLERQIQSDPLTGALNRAGLASRLTHELSRVHRSGGPLAVVAIDLDDFKAINDRLGHHAGDQTLTTVVADLRRSLRPHDTVARMGGDEFVILLPETTADDATVIMKRLQADAASPWTFGITAAHPSDNQDSLLRRADEDLYVQKRGLPRTASD